MKKLLLSLGLFSFWPICAWAQTPLHVVLGTESTTGCLGIVVPCWAPTTQSGGGSGGAVTQSGTWQVNLGYGGSTVSSSNPLGTADLALDALIAGGKLPVSVASLPLPAGAATSANQAAINGDGGSQVHVQNFPATQPISAASLPLPTGAATSANQSSVNADGGSQVHLQNSIPTGTGSAAAGATTITTASTYQSLFTAASIVHGCYVQNPATNTSGNLYVDWAGTTGTTLSATAQLIQPGQTVNCAFLPSNAVTVYSTTASLPFIAGKF